MAAGTDDTKVVQTELSRAEYRRLEALAEQEERSLKGLLRDAARAYSDRHLAYDDEDPLFAADAADGPPTDAATTEERLADAVRTDEDGDE